MTHHQISKAPDRFPVFPSCIPVIFSNFTSDAEYTSKFDVHKRTAWVFFFLNLADLPCSAGHTVGVEKLTLTCMYTSMKCP